MNSDLIKVLEKIESFNFKFPITGEVLIRTVNLCVDTPNFGIEPKIEIWRSINSDLAFSYKMIPSIKGFKPSNVSAPTEMEALSLALENLDMCLRDHDITDDSFETF